jgi:hypothetical protein
MAMYLFKSIKSGDYKPAGVVEVPFLGAKVGDLSAWSLVRRGDEDPDASLYDLRATFAFVSEALWDDPEFDKVIVLNLNPKKQYRLQQAEGFPMVRDGRSLLIEGVTIHAIDGKR